MIDIEYENRLDALSFADWKEWRNLFLFGRATYPHCGGEPKLVRPSLAFRFAKNKDQMRYELRMKGPLPWYAL